MQTGLGRSSRLVGSGLLGRKENQAFPRARMFLRVVIPQLHYASRFSELV